MIGSSLRYLLLSYYSEKLTNNSAVLLGLTGSALSKAEQGSFYRALQPNEASESREGQLYGQRDDIFTMFHSQIAMKFVCLDTPAFSV